MVINKSLRPLLQCALREQLGLEFFISTTVEEAAKYAETLDGGHTVEIDSKTGRGSVRKRRNHPKIAKYGKFASKILPPVNTGLTAISVPDIARKCAIECIRPTCDL